LFRQKLEKNLRHPEDQQGFGAALQYRIEKNDA
jgi:hypothetical protein